MHTASSADKARTVVNNPARLQAAVTLPGSFTPFTRVVLYRDINDPNLRALHHDFAQAYATSPFQDPEWQTAWHTATDPGGRSSPCTIVAYDGNRPAVLWPLCLQKSAVWQILTWRAAEVSDYCEPLATAEGRAALTPETLRRILQSAVSALGGVAAVILSRQPHRAPASEAAAALKHHIEAHATRLLPDWNQYVRSKRSGRTLRKLDWSLRSLAKQGNLTISFAVSAEDATARASRGLALKATQLKGRKRSSPIAAPAAQAMMASYFGSRVDRGTWVASLDLDGQPLAVAFGFRSQNSWLMYQLAMQEGQLSSYSPGTHLLMYVLRHCCEAGVAEFDFSVGDEDYKSNWCESQTPLFAEVYAFGFRGHVYAACCRFNLGLLRVVTRTPWLLRLGRLAERHLQTLRAGGTTPRLEN